MATAEQVGSKPKKTESEFDYEILTNRNLKVIEGLRKIGVILDAEFKAEEEEQTRKAKSNA